MLFDDAIILRDETKGANNRLQKWRNTSASKGFRLRIENYVARMQAYEG